MPNKPKSPSPIKSAVGVFLGLYFILAASVGVLYWQLYVGFNSQIASYAEATAPLLQTTARELPFPFEPGTPTHQKSYLDWKSDTKAISQTQFIQLIQLTSNTQGRIILDNTSPAPSPRTTSFPSAQIPAPLQLALTQLLQGNGHQLIPKEEGTWWKVPGKYYLVVSVNRTHRLFTYSEVDMTNYLKSLSTLQGLLPILGLSVTIVTTLVSIFIYVLARRWKTASNQFKQAAEFQRYLLYSFPSPVCFLDSSGRIAFFNSALPKAFNTSVELLNKREISSLLPEMDLHGNSIQTCVHTLHTGEVKHFLVHITKITQGQQPGTIVNLVDLSELHNAQRHAFIASTSLDHAPTGIGVLNTELKLVRSNNQFDEFLNLEDVAFKDALSRLTPKLPDLSTLFEETNKWSGVVISGTSTFQCSINRIEFDNEPYLVIVLNDVTPIKQKEIELVAVNKNLEDKTIQANNMAVLAEQSAASKAEFLAIMSHEIRTPLNGIIGYTDLLQETPINADQLTLVKNLQSCSRHLHSLVNDILDYSKYEAGKYEPEYTDFDLINMCHDVLAVQMPKAEAKAVRIDLRTPPDLPQFVRSDHLRLNQVLTNLLSNALKFTPQKGVIRIHCTVHNKQLQLQVEDSGPGIANENLEKIFLPFTQEDASTTRKYGGTGLGLSICRQIITGLGGTITASNKAPNGAVFTVNVPLQSLLTTKEPARIQPKEWNPGFWATQKVLVMEDNPNNLVILERYLKKLGLEADMCEDGESGLVLAQKHKYDVIILDMLMPKMNGLEVLRNLRKGGASKEAWATLLTANTNLRGEDPASMGFNAFLSKPYTFEELKRTLLQHQVD